MIQHEGWTHEEWHKVNEISADSCPTCQKHGRIITDAELISMANAENGVEYGIKHSQSCNDYTCKGSCFDQKAEGGIIRSLIVRDFKTWKQETREGIKYHNSVSIKEDRARLDREIKHLKDQIARLEWQRKKITKKKLDISEAAYQRYLASNSRSAIESGLCLKISKGVE